MASYVYGHCQVQWQMKRAATRLRAVRTTYTRLTWRSLGLGLSEFSLRFTYFHVISKVYQFYNLLSGKFVSAIMFRKLFGTTLRPTRAVASRVPLNIDRLLLML